MIPNNLSKENQLQMDWFIFKTDITTKNQVQQLSLVLSVYTDDSSWTIDLEDCDHVFRIASNTQLKEHQVVGLLQRHGFHIEPLSE